MVYRRSNLVVFVVCFHTLVSFVAASPVPPLEKEVAHRIIAEYEGMRLVDVQVAIVLEGEAPSKGFTAKHASKVIYIARRLEEGGRYRRRACEIVFQHDREYGWYLKVVRSSDLKDTIEIWSELCGCIRIG
ncbi:MAG: hypothetical protein AAGA58_11730 [Verrucomicrobiota bacterium]